MEYLTVLGIFKVLGEVGVLGLIIVLWWIDTKKIYKILEQYKSDMDEHRMMYQRNVSLVRDYHLVATDLKDVVILNTEAITKLAERLKRE